MRWRLHIDPSWPRFIESLRACVSTWIFCVVCLSLVRIVFIALFWQRTGSGATAELGAALMHGVRFDLRVVTQWLIPVGIVGLAHCVVDLHRPLGLLLRWFGTLFVAVTPLLAAVAIGYYAEFDRPFGARLFDFFYDDTAAILATVVSDHGLIGYLAVCATASAAGLFALRRWEELRLGSRWLAQLFTIGFYPRMTLILMVAIGALGATRGSLGGRPAMRKWSGITSDRLLNDAVLNPYSALSYALKDHLRLNGAAKLETYIPDRDVAAAAQRLLRNAGRSGSVPNNIDVAFSRLASGPKVKRPPPIFLIVLESYDIWPLLPEYAGYGVGTELKKLAARGLFFDRFVPNAESTMAALATILVGLPDAGVFTSRQRTAQQTYPSALAAIFARLGYQTRAFYGGMMSWQRLGDFCRTQGFSETFDRSAIDPSFASGWGIDDGPLFDFVADKVSADDVPSLNLIMTLSYHPPYDIDLAAAGFPKEPPPGFVPSKRLSLRHLGHLWYADQQLGAFVARMQERLPDALFVITGDHMSRRYPSDRPSAYVSSAVPLVLYGPRALADIGPTLPAGGIGSHIDILPTLVELVAPAGFEYTAFGRDLLVPATDGPVFGFGMQRIIGSDMLIDLRGEAIGANQGQPVVHALGGAAAGAEGDEGMDVAALKRHYDDLYGIAWHRIVRGSAIGTESP